jgi:hypothetical protein
MLVLLLLRRPECRARGMAVLAMGCACVILRQMLILPWLDGAENLTFRVTLPLGAALIVPAGHGGPGRAAQASSRESTDAAGDRLLRGRGDPCAGGLHGAHPAAGKRRRPVGGAGNAPGPRAGFFRLLPAGSVAADPGHGSAASADRTARTRSTMPCSSSSGSDEPTWPKPTTTPTTNT